MIVSFKSKALKRFFEKGDSSKLNPNHVDRIRDLLKILNNAKELRELNFPGSGLHSLKGNLQGHYALKVSGNWRLTFQFIDGKVHVLDYQDYH